MKIDYILVVYNSMLRYRTILPIVRNPKESYCIAKLVLNAYFV